MKRFLLAVLLCAVAFPVHAEPKVDQAQFMFHLKETFGIPPGVDMKLGSWEKSEIPGLWKVKLTLTKGEQTQDRDIYVSEDGKHYLVADIQDVSKLPDQENLKLLKTEGAPAKGGGKDAKVTVVEYTDFECPYCKKAHESIEDNLFKTYGDRVRLVYKAYPLTGIHPWSQSASLAGACVAKLKPAAFWSFADDMFKNQEEINAAVMAPDHRSADQDKVKAKLSDIAADSKVDKAKFTACLGDKTMLDIVTKDQSEGDLLGVNSTPTLFVNGHKLTGYSSFDSLKSLIDEMLAGTHGPAKSS